MSEHDTPAHSRNTLTLLEAMDQEGNGIDRPGLHASQGELPENETFGDVLARSMARRAFLLGAAASVPVLMAGATLLPSAAEAATKDGLNFKPISPSTLDEVVVPVDYFHEVVVKWGDPLFPGAPAFNFKNQTAAAQKQQFGYNSDFLGYFQLNGSNRALLAVNHEYTSGTEMFRNYVPGAKKEETDIEIAAHGGSVVELVRDYSGWRYVKNSKYNRRITGDTPMIITGPAAGHKLMKTKADRSGKHVLGMLNNCSGGKTPWGTWLTCEENFNQYFANNDQTADADVKAAHARYGVSGGATFRLWEKFYDRFDCSKEPNEAFRFGWVVEIDPYNPNFVPRKRTALGRCKHEAATMALANDGRAVVYSGDDERFDYVYKFVSRDRYNPGNRADNFDLLDHGTLYVAKFRDDNTGVWIPLTITHPKLQGKFADQGEILMKTRLAADAVGATAMDRPEDCQPNPVNGKVYLTMTNNSKRTSVVPDAGSALANPRVPNYNGHIIELTEGGNDHGSTKFRWEIFLLAGDPKVDLKTNKADLTPGLPSNTTFFAGYADADKLGKVSCPDNIAFDSRGNLWIATDGQPESVDIGMPNDAIHAVPTAGPDRGYLRQFLSGPKGCEICGPEFSSDETTLFCAVQHPGEGGGVPNQISNWPDRGIFTRPGVVAVRHRDSRKIGG